MATWPLDLPQHPLRDPWQETMGWGVISSQPDTGPAMTRRRFTAVEKPVSAEFNMKVAQRASFESFFEDELAGGALPFDAPWVGRVRTYRVVESPEWRTRGNQWRLRLTLMVQP